MIPKKGKKKPEHGGDRGLGLVNEMAGETISFGIGGTSANRWDDDLHL